MADDDGVNNCVDNCVDNLDGLRSLYRDPSVIVLNKAIDHIDDGAAGFIANSPLCVLATTSGTTTDASPRGGPPGFVHVVDRHRLAFGDLVGNNRLDSYRNLVDQPAIGMLFMVPGLLETLRVNGLARVTTDADLRTACALDGRIPKVAIVVEVSECFIHCGAAFRRGQVWEPSTWVGADRRPSAAAIFRDHAGLDVPADVIESDLADYYDTGVWEVGGTPDR